MAVAAALVVAEVVGWGLMRWTRLGELADANPVRTIDDPEQLWPRVLDQPIEIPEDVSRLEVRDTSDREGREDRIWLDEPPDDPVALLVGGSSPLGVGLENRDTFWWRLERDVPDGVCFLNVASVGDNSHEVRHQIARTVAFGARIRLVVVYTGDNEWNWFRYPDLDGAGTGRLDAVLMRSNAYLSLRTLLRLGAQSTVYEDLEAARSDAALSLSRFPLDTRRRSFTPRMREFVDGCRGRLLDAFVANLQAVIELSRARGARVLLLTNPIKYRLSPAHNIAQVATERHAGTAVEDELVGLLSDGVDALLAGDLETAETTLAAALRLDPSSSLTNHYLGYLWAARGDPARAREHFLTARDRTIGGGGLMAEINRAIRATAGDYDVPLVDLETAFARSSDLNGDGLADELVMDWCHPSAAGAGLIYDELRGPVAVALGQPSQRADGPASGG